MRCAAPTQTATADAAPPPLVLRTGTYTSGALAAGAAGSATIDLAAAFRAVAVTTSVPARVRLYATAAAQAADVARAVGTDPGYGAGVILDVLTTGSGELYLTPEPTGHSRETPPVAAIPITVNPVTAATVTVTVRYERLG